jgi:hypothetical protein
LKVKCKDYARKRKLASNLPIGDKAIAILKRLRINASATFLIKSLGLFIQPTMV